ncbi:MAG: TIR domain-containing protein [Phenylobacterium sp.]
MSEVFISYARSSAADAQRISEALRAVGYQVWRDDELPPHRAYSEVIEERLQAAKAVVVLWSEEAARSQWVRAEADIARQAGKLVQVSLGQIVPPLPFNQIQCVNLAEWPGAGDHDWRKVLASLDALLGAEGPPIGANGGDRAGDLQAQPWLRSEPKRRAAPRLSIVVLPFANMSRDPDQEYFVDGITESLTTDLSRLRGSFVIARNTAFTFKNKPMDATAIGETLNVRYVLEGSLQRGSDRLRVNVQLIDVASGSHIWADRFDMPLADIFEMQDEIVTRLARALDVHLVAAEARRSQGAVDTDSMDLYYQGQAVVNQGFGPEAAIQARALFEKSLELDPNNVDALAALSQYNALAIALAFTTDGGDASFAGAEALAIRALDLAPNHAVAHLSLAQVYSFTDRVPQALAEYQRALDLDRNFAHAYAGFAAASMYGGQSEAAEPHILKAFRLSPHDHQGHLWCLIAGTAKLFLDDDAAAEAWFRRGIEINRAYPIHILYLAAALVGLDRLDEARAAAKQALALNPRFSLRLVRSIRRSTNPTYVAQLATVLEKLKLAGIPEE